MSGETVILFVAIIFAIVGIACLAIGMFVAMGLVIA